MLLLFLIIVVHLERSSEAVIRSEKVEENELFSPYFAAFSDFEKTRIKEYERLKRSLMHFKAIDWDYVVQPKITDSEYSSSL